MIEQEDYYDKLNNRYTSIYSTGGFYERSRNQRIGKMVNKNYEDTNPANKSIEEIFERITDTYYKGK